MSLDEIYTKSDLLSLHKLKPLWETFRTYTIAALIATSLFLLYKSDGDPLRCFPLNNTERFTTAKMIFINEECKEEANFFQTNHWWISILVTTVLYVVMNIWEHVPAVINEVRKFKNLFDDVVDFDDSVDVLVKLVTTANSPNETDLERQKRMCCRRITKALFQKRKKDNPMPIRVKLLLDNLHKDAVRFFLAYPYLDFNSSDFQILNYPLLYNKWGTYSQLNSALSSEQINTVPNIEEHLNLRDIWEVDMTAKLGTLILRLRRGEKIHDISSLGSTPANILTALADLSIANRQTVSVDSSVTVSLLIALRQIENIRKLKEVLLDVTKDEYICVLNSIQEDAQTLVRLLRTKDEMEILKKMEPTFLLPLSPQTISEWKLNETVTEYFSHKQFNETSKQKVKMALETEFTTNTLTQEQLDQLQSKLTDFFTSLESSSVLELLESIRELQVHAQLDSQNLENLSVRIDSQNSLVKNIRMVEAYKQLLALRQTVTVLELKTLFQNNPGYNDAGNQVDPKKECSCSSLYCWRNFFSFAIALATIVVYSKYYWSTNANFICSHTYKCIYTSIRMPQVIGIAQIIMMTLLCIVFSVLVFKFLCRKHNIDQETDFLLWLCRNSGETKNVEFFKLLRKGIREKGKLIIRGLQKNLISAVSAGDVAFFQFYLDITGDDINKFLNSRFVQNNTDEKIAKTIIYLKEFAKKAEYDSNGNSEAASCENPGSVTGDNPETNTGDNPERQPLC